jgi:hypothetical protein
MPGAAFFVFFVVNSEGGEKATTKKTKDAKGRGWNGKEYA